LHLKKNLHGASIFAQLSPTVAVLAETPWKSIDVLVAVEAPETGRVGHAVAARGTVATPVTRSSNADKESSGHEDQGGQSGKKLHLTITLDLLAFHLVSVFCGLRRRPYHLASRIVGRLSSYRVKRKRYRTRLALCHQ
jgi:hypothetical protein